jgi:hypothetical protein
MDSSLRNDGMLGLLITLFFQQIGAQAIGVGTLRASPWSIPR